jgi:hypothetical protein
MDHRDISGPSQNSCEEAVDDFQRSTQMKLFTRLRLFLHVLANGCRIVDFANLKCEGCKYEPICKLGRYDPK